MQRTGGKKSKSKAFFITPGAKADGSTSQSRVSDQAAKAVSQQGLPAGNLRNILTPRSVQGSPSSSPPSQRSSDSSSSNSSRSNSGSSSPSTPRHLEEGQLRRGLLIQDFKTSLAQVDKLKTRLFILEAREESSATIKQATEALGVARSNARKIAAEIDMYDQVLIDDLKERCSKLEYELAEHGERAKERLRKDLRSAAEELAQIADAKRERERELTPESASKAPEKRSVRMSWPVIRMHLGSMRSAVEVATDQDLRRAMQALRAAVPGLDMQDAVFSLVRQFSDACLSKQTEVALLLDLIDSSSSIPGQARLLALLTQGIKLDLGKPPSEEGLALQQPLDHISALLQLLQAETAGARSFAALMDRHAKRMKAQVDPQLVLQMLGEKSVDLGTLQSFLKRYANHGSHANTRGLPPLPGAAKAQAVLRQL